MSQLLLVAQKFYVLILSIERNRKYLNLETIF